MHKILIAFVTVGTLVACGASTPGAQPHDMSAAGHEQAAREHEHTAETHAAQFDASAGVATERCANVRVDTAGGACWTSMRNPTQAHLDEAAKHRKMAEDHRAASHALRDAEASACVGIPEEDRDESPFEHREDIAKVEPLNTNVISGKTQLSRMEGAVITFRAVQGMTAQWLQRVVDCHLARNAALGHVVPEMPSCPLVPKGVTAKVTATDNGFAVAVRSDDSATAQEVLRRANSLVGR